jgi:hypothetical protein
MSLGSQKLPQTLDIDQTQAVHRVSPENNVLARPSGFRKTHVLRYMHAEGLAQFKGDPNAVVAPREMKDVANALSSFAENMHTAHSWFGVGIAFLPVGELVDLLLNDRRAIDRLLSAKAIFLDDAFAWMRVSLEIMDILLKRGR